MLRTMSRWRSLHSCHLRRTIISSFNRNSSNARVSEVNSIGFPVLKINQNGGSESLFLPMINLLREKLHARDLLALGLTNMPSRTGVEQQPERPTPSLLLPRRSCILASFGSIKTIIHRDHILILDPHRAVVRTWAEEISLSLLRRSSNGDDEYSEKETPFELFVLEELLREMCDVYDRRMIIYRPLAHSLLKEVEVASDAIEGVHKLVPLSDGLYEFEMLVKESQQCLLDMLDKEEELTDLLISEDSSAESTVAVMATTIGETGGKNKSEGELQSEEEDEYTPRDEVQFLLESYVLRLNNILNDITLLQQKVKNRQSLTDISMQIQRNRLLWLNLNLGIAAVCIGASTAISGWFGMNLNSGLEENPLAFPLIVTSSSLVALLLYQRTRRYINSNSYYKDVENKHVQERQLLKSIFSDIYSIDAAVRQVFTEMERPQSSGTMKKEDFMKIIRNKAREGPGQSATGGKDTVAPANSSSRESSQNVSAASNAAVVQETSAGASVKDPMSNGAPVDKIVAEAIFNLLDSDTDGQLHRSFTSSAAFNNWLHSSTHGGTGLGYGDERYLLMKTLQRRKPPRSNVNNDL